MTVRCLVEIQGATGMPEDVYVNTFHFNPPGSVTGDVLDECFTAITGFYNTAQAGATNDVAAWIANSVLRTTNAHKITYYDLFDPEPRVPVREDTWTLDAALSGGDLPAEVAAVLSYRGTYTSGIARARQRGRLYIGPLIDDALTSALPGPPVLATQIRTDLTSNADWLANTTHGTPAVDEVKWVVYSGAARDNTDPSIPYLDRPLLAPITTDIDQGWMDNAFDTQRRRGRAETARTTFS